jgi:hypothetical protein
MRALTVVVLAACSSHSGAYVEVKVADPSIGTVALYIGQDPCTVQKMGSAVDCPSIGPQGQLAPLQVGSAGGAWFRDNDQPDESVVDSTGVATFHLLADGSEQTVEILAIGLAGDPAAKDARATGVLDGVVIPAGEAKEIMMTLEPALPVASDETTRTAQPDGNYVLLWQDPAAPADCALAETWSNGVATRKFVVPGEDADCDGLPTLDTSGMRNPKECDALWYLRPTPTENGQSDCATPYATSSNPGVAPVCMLGGPGCIDGTGKDPTQCTKMPSNYCLPQSVCGTHCAMPGSSPIGPCVALALGNTTAYHCEISSQVDGTPCPATGTNPTTAMLDFSQLFAGSMQSCDQLRFAPDSLNNFQSSDTLMLQNTTAMFQTNQVTSSNGSCVWSLTWDGSPYTVDAEGWALADLSVSNGNHLVIPIQFSRLQCLSGAKTAFYCYPYVASMAGDSITSCAQ